MAKSLPEFRRQCRLLIAVMLGFTATRRGPTDETKRNLVNARKRPKTGALPHGQLVISMAAGGGVRTGNARVKAESVASVLTRSNWPERFSPADSSASEHHVVSPRSDQPTGFCAASVGVSGHMATRLLFPSSGMLESKINSMVDGDAGQWATGRAQDRQRVKSRPWRLAELTRIACQLLGSVCFASP